MIRVTTASGAVYEFNDRDQVRRTADDLATNPDYLRSDKRGDGEWLQLRQPVEPTIGEVMWLQLEPLDPEATITVRQTTPVTAITHEGAAE